MCKKKYFRNAYFETPITSKKNTRPGKAILQSMLLQLTLKDSNSISKHDT